MEELLQGDHSSTDIAIIERVDAFLSGFISSERKSRSKMKLNYIIAGASSNRLESAVNLLSETDQIDDDLILFIDSLIRKKNQSPKNNHMAGTNYDDEGLPNPYGTRPRMLTEEGDLTQESDDDPIGLAEGKDATAVLQMVRKRLMAEIRTIDKPEVRLLSTLLMENTDKYSELMRASLKKVEEMERFETFLVNGIQHLSTDHAMENNEDCRAEMSDSSVSRPFQATQKPSDSKARLPADTIARA